MTLFVVATPIGNLADLTSRATDVLRRAPVVFAEDTRQARKLLSHIGAHPRLVAYHHHTRGGALEKLLDVLEASDVALVTDAGTPGISDPGGLLIAAALDRFGRSLTITPIPGPSALTAAVSVAGFPTDRFHMYGFPPHKKGRQTYFQEIAALSETVVFFESSHRIQKAMAELSVLAPDRSCMVARELTKLFETIERGSVREVAGALATVQPRGEYVVVLGPRPPAA